MDSKKIIPCPHCKKLVEYTVKNPYRPFCSERCKLIDLGQWLIESYRIPSSDDQTDDMTEHGGNDSSQQ